MTERCLFFLFQNNFWHSTVTIPTETWPALASDKQVEVAIVGAGATGVELSAELHNAVKDSGTNIKQIANGLKCNGADPVTFAMDYDAEKMAEFLARKTRADAKDMLTKL